MASDVDPPGVPLGTPDTVEVVSDTDSSAPQDASSVSGEDTEAVVVLTRNPRRRNALTLDESSRLFIDTLTDGDSSTEERTPELRNPRRRNALTSEESSRLQTLLEGHVAAVEVQRNPRRRPALTTRTSVQVHDALQVQAAELLDAPSSERPASEAARSPLSPSADGRPDGVQWVNGFERNLEHEVCAVCLEDMQVGEELGQWPGCLHLFHNACIVLWLAHAATCPTCRRIIDESSQTEGTLSPA